MTKLSPQPTSSDWLDELLSDSRAVVEQLLLEAPIPIATLRQQVQAYRSRVDADTSPLADHSIAEQLIHGALALLDAVQDRTADQPLAQVAVRYFVLDDDGDDDLASAFGLDDDVEVFNAVCAHLGLDDLLISF